MGFPSGAKQVSRGVLPVLSFPAVVVHPDDVAVLSSNLAIYIEALRGFVWVEEGR
jgi:hypothetical protein